MSKHLCNFCGWKAKGRIVANRKGGHTEEILDVCAKHGPEKAEQLRRAGLEVGYDPNWWPRMIPAYRQAFAKVYGGKRR